MGLVSWIALNLSPSTPTHKSHNENEWGIFFEKTLLYTNIFFMLLHVREKWNDVIYDHTNFFHHINRFYIKKSCFFLASSLGYRHKIITLNFKALNSVNQKFMDGSSFQYLYACEWIFFNVRSNVFPSLLWWLLFLMNNIYIQA